MNRLYAPWRHAYITRVAGKEKKDDTLMKVPEVDCVFCKQIKENDDDKYAVIKRFSHCFVMMNFYPYNAGHVMVLPFLHKGSLEELSSEIRADMMEAVSQSVSVIGTVLGAEGFNIGINLGVAGGGGIPSHVHIHILPRWRGDTNFLETIGQTKLISADIAKTFQDLKVGFQRIK